MTRSYQIVGKVALQHHHQVSSQPLPHPNHCLIPTRSHNLTTTEIQRTIVTRPHGLLRAGAGRSGGSSDHGGRSGVVVVAGGQWKGGGRRSTKTQGKTSLGDDMDGNVFEIFGFVLELFQLQWHGVGALNTGGRGGGGGGHHDPTCI